MCLGCGHELGGCSVVVVHGGHGAIEVLRLVLHLLLKVLMKLVLVLRTATQKSEIARLTMTAHRHPHDTTTLNLLVVLIHEIAYLGTNRQILIILLFLILSPINDSSLLSLLHQPCFQARSLDTPLILLLKVLLLLLGVRIHELLNLLLSLEENFEVILTIIHHVFQLKIDHNLLVNFVQFVRNSEAGSELGWLDFEDLLEHFETLLQVFWQRDVLVQFI